MLVTVSGGVTSSTADYYGEIPIDDGSGMSAMDDHNWDVSTFLEETFDDNYADYVVESITSFVIYSYSTFEIAPRRERLCLRAVGVSDRHAAADDIARADGTADRVSSALDGAGARADSGVPRRYAISDIQKRHC